jgi:hypothetical protein
MHVLCFVLFAFVKIFFLLTPFIFFSFFLFSFFYFFFSLSLFLIFTHFLVFFSFWLSRDALSDWWIARWTGACRGSWWRMAAWTLVSWLHTARLPLSSPRTKVCLTDLILFLIWFDLIRCLFCWIALSCFDTLLIWFDLMWCDSLLIWCDSLLIWFDLIWFDLIWFDLR